MRRLALIFLSLLPAVLPLRAQVDSAGVAKTLSLVDGYILALEQEELMQKAADVIIDNNMSTREAEVFVGRVQKDPNFFQQKPLKEGSTTERVFITDVEDRLKLVFGSPVRIALGPKKSKIEITFKTQEDLDRIVEAVESLTKQHEEKVEFTKKKLREVSTTLFTV